MITFVNDSQSATDLFNWARNAGDGVAIDIEGANLLAPHMNKVRLVQFGDTEKAFAVPTDVENGYIEGPNVVRRVIQILEGTEKYFHNASYDVPQLVYHIMSEDYEWDWHHTEDTMLACQNLWPNESAKLKVVTKKRIMDGADGGEKKLEAVKKANGWDWETIPVDTKEYWAYGGLDTILTARLGQLLQSHGIFDRDKSYRTDMESLAVTCEMSMRGIKIDRNYCQQKMDEKMESFHRLRNVVRDQYGISNPGSGPQLVKYFQSLGVKFTKKTPAGSYAMDKEVLGGLVRDGFVEADHILKMKKDYKKANSYFKNFLEYADENGIIHAKIHNSGAKTGRMSVSEPSLQNIPADDGEVRRGYIVRDPNNVFVTCDYDQLEARIVANLSGDEKLQQLFFEEGSFFENLASQMFGTKILKSDPRYKLSKNTFYAFQYGSGVNKMAKTAGIPFKRAHQLRSKFVRSFQQMADWSKEIITEAKEHTAKGWTPHVITPNGKKLYSFPGAEYKLVNYLIQGFATEILKKALADSRKWNIDKKMVLVIHDEIISEVPRSEAQNYAEKLEYIMTDTSWPVPLTAGAEIYEKSWGAKYE